MSTRRLTDKQKNFIDEYLMSLNGTEAVIKTHPNVKTRQTAASMAYEYLRLPHIQKYKRKIMEEREKGIRTSQEEVLKGLINIATANLKELCEWETVDGEKQLVLKDLDLLTPDQTDAIKEISETVKPNGTRQLKVKFFNKLKARELLGKHLGMFSDTVKVQGIEALVNILQKDPFEENEAKSKRD